MYPLRYACNSLTNFEYEVYAMTGNGNDLNLLKRAWKKPVKSLQVNLFTCDAWFCRQLLAMDFKSLPDQIKLLWWLTHTLLGLKKRNSWNWLITLMPAIAWQILNILKVYAMTGNGNLIKSSFYDDSLIICWAYKKESSFFNAPEPKIIH